MNANKPVAWMTFDGEYSYDLMLVEGNEDYQNEYIKRNGEKYKGWVQPLYTHPAKTLTDEEIKELWKPLPDTKTYDSDILKFARAILKKANK